MHTVGQSATSIIAAATHGLSLRTFGRYSGNPVDVGRRDHIATSGFAALRLFPEPQNLRLAEAIAVDRRVSWGTSGRVLSHD